MNLVRMLEITHKITHYYICLIVHFMIYTSILLTSSEYSEQYEIELIEQVMNERTSGHKMLCLRKSFSFC